MLYIINNPHKLDWAKVGTFIMPLQIVYIFCTTLYFTHRLTLSHNWSIIFLKIWAFLTVIQHIGELCWNFYSPLLLKKSYQCLEITLPRNHFLVLIFPLNYRGLTLSPNIKHCLWLNSGWSIHIFRSIVGKKELIYSPMAEHLRALPIIWWVLF